MSDMSEYLVKGYLPTIGIECHVQLKTKTKLFSTASNESRGAEPNTLVDQICFGYPGALPVLNEEAVRLAARAAYALGTTPQKFSKFDRKHYFYPDLPLGYQISQFDEPIILGGSIEVSMEDGSTKMINITRAHMEADAGKSTHPAGADYSLVDLNRAGTPLLEIVSEPDMHSAAEAKAFAKELWLRMKYADVSEADLYHGNMRFDVNVSVSKNDELGTRSETKNLNSFRSVERAVEFEVGRQIKLLEAGEKMVQETRGWIDDEQKTVSQRSKEDAQDYRYFPDPDIPPIVLDDEYIELIAKEAPLMPDVWRKKLQDIGVGRKQTEAIIEAQVVFDADFLGHIVGCDKKQAATYANWITNIEVPLRREQQEKESDVRVSDQDRRAIYSSVYALISGNKISSNSAKAIFSELLIADKLPKNIEKYAEDKGYIQESDEGAIEQVVNKVLEANPKAVEDIKTGEMKVIGFLVGQVMKESKGKANPALAQKIIKAQLGV